MTKDWARPVVHFEITARDPERLRTFYAELFSWDIGVGPLMNIRAGLGGPEPGPAGHIRHSERTGITLYIQVRDIGESLAQAAALGGAVTLEQLNVPGGPTIAGITDPEGNPLTLVQQ
jgi:predicted enzyme related to lactoylglutathione lyase